MPIREKSCPQCAARQSAAVAKGAALEQTLFWLVAAVLLAAVIAVAWHTAPSDPAKPISIFSFFKDYAAPFISMSALVFAYLTVQGLRDQIATAKEDVQVARNQAAEERRGRIIPEWSLLKERERHLLMMVEVFENFPTGQADAQNILEKIFKTLDELDKKHLYRNSATRNSFTAAFMEYGRLRQKFSEEFYGRTIDHRAAPRQAMVADMGEQVRRMLQATKNEANFVWNLLESIDAQLDPRLVAPQAAPWWQRWTGSA